MMDQDSKLGRNLECITAVLLAITILSASVPYFVFYASDISQSVGAGILPATGIVRLKIHIVAYWISYSLYFMGLLLAVIHFIRKSTTRFPWIETATLFATIMAVVGLITGILYSKPAWNVWWVWDAKHTVVLLNTISLFVISLFVVLSRKFSSVTERNGALVILLFAAVASCVWSLLIGFFFRIIHPQWFPFITFQR